MNLLPSMGAAAAKAPLSIPIWLCCAAAFFRPPGARGEGGGKRWTSQQTKKEKEKKAGLARARDTVFDASMSVRQRSVQRAWAC